MRIREHQMRHEDEEEKNRTNGIVFDTILVIVSAIKNPILSMKKKSARKKSN